MPYKYKNVSNRRLTITSGGNISPRIVNAGAEVVSSVPLENPNFKYIGEADAPMIQGFVTEDQPGTITEATNVDNQTNKENQ